jgi:hypothetical protein
MTEKKDLEAVEKLNETRNKIKNEIKKVIIGQDRVIDELLIALLSIQVWSGVSHFAFWGGSGS